MAKNFFAFVLISSFVLLTACAQKRPKDINLKESAKEAARINSKESAKEAATINLSCKGYKYVNIFNGKKRIFGDLLHLRIDSEKKTMTQWDGPKATEWLISENSESYFFSTAIADTSGTKETTSKDSKTYAIFYKYTGEFISQKNFSDSRYFYLCGLAENLLEIKFEENLLKKKLKESINK